VKDIMKDRHRKRNRENTGQNEKVKKERENKKDTMTKRQR